MPLGDSQRDQTLPGVWAVSDVPAWPTLEEVEGCDDVETVLRWNRFLPSPIDGEQATVIGVVVTRLRNLRKADPSAFTRASKKLGWD